MSQPIAEHFIDALGRLEADGDPEPLLELFAEDCEVHNVTLAHGFHGRDGARRFWETDRGVFSEIRSDFHTVLESDDRAALEWTRTGTSRDGAPMEYPGASFLDLQDGRIVRFMAYFHPRELGRQTTEPARAA